MEPCCRSPDLFSADGLNCCQSCGSIKQEQETGDVLSQALLSSLRISSSSSSSITTSPYTYLPVQDGEFRLVEIQAGKSDDPLICQIFHGRINEETYEALSYTWATEDGKQELSQEIIVCLSGALGARTVRATVNCERALRRIRLDHEVRVLWVDALCINQGDLVECGHQVRHMQAIFANATKVIVYLGEASEACDHVMRCFETADWHSVAQYSDHVRQFLRLRWFSRIWCLQEIAMARKIGVYCGQRALPWGSIPVARLTEHLPAHQNIPLILRLQLHGRQDASRFCSMLLEARRSCQASDPRDMIYAILGLIGDQHALGLEVDYKKPVGELYNQVMETLLLRHGLDCISQAEFRPKPRLPWYVTLASWAIDWTIAQPTCWSLSPGLANKQKEINTFCTFSWIARPGQMLARVLSMSGTQVGRILLPENQKLGLRPFKEGILRSPDANSSLHLATAYGRLSTDGTADAFDRTEDRSNYFGLRPPMVEHFFVTRWITLSELLRWLPLNHRGDLRDHVLFCLDTFCAGVGPSTLGSSDVLVKFKGSHRTYFLREQGDHYTFVGEALIIPHDVFMHPEAFQDYLKTRSSRHENWLSLLAQFLRREQDPRFRDESLALANVTVEHFDIW